MGAEDLTSWNLRTYASDSAGVTIGRSEDCSTWRSRWHPVGFWEVRRFNQGLESVCPGSKGHPRAVKIQRRTLLL